MKIRNYCELHGFSTFAERYRYLALNGRVGDPTFGFDRYINQQFYRSAQWRRVRDLVIARDNGCDLGIEGREIYDKIIIHHMNPMLPQDIIGADESILDLEYLICTTLKTHNAIHYGDESLLQKEHVDRKPGDTRLWSRRSVS